MRAATSGATRLTPTGTRAPAGSLGLRPCPRPAPPFGFLVGWSMLCDKVTRLVGRLFNRYYFAAVVFHAVN
jgi:hypothetical protein